jgi:hypothetical protein
MSNPDARVALAKLIERRMNELRIDRSDFMTRTGFTQESTFTCYLRGFSNLQLWQVPSVAKILQLDERDVLLMCLGQFYDASVLALFHRNIRPRRRQKR